MLKSSIVRIVELSTRFAWVVIFLAAILAGFCAQYAAGHFSVETDVRQLFPADLPWTVRANRFMASFPQYNVLAVVEAPSPELTERASASLVASLKMDPKHIAAVEEPEGGSFFVRNGLVFLPLGQLAQMTSGMQNSGPLIGSLASDPSLRGALNALSGGLSGVANGMIGLDSLARPMTAAADTTGDVLARRPAHFSWRWLLVSEPQQRSQLRRFIQIAPVLDFKALEPGRAATDAIMSIARSLNLAGNYQAHVRITGLVPMNDAQFATLKENAAPNAAVSIGAVLLILWLALRSWRIILPTLISVICGLCYSAALGLFLVKSLNLISVAFFVLFVGLAVDFGIQFSVRYRAERHETDDLARSLSIAARKAGWPLALAAAATALGFSSFLPTNYRGLSELGEVAGPGMIVAFLTTITLLPALLRVLKPPPEPLPMGFVALAPVDRFLQRHRYGVLIGTLALVWLASPLLVLLRFDFNTLHLENPRAAPVATFLELRRDAAAAANAVELIAPNLDAAKADSAKFARLPQVSSTRTLASLVPDDQRAKLSLIRQLASRLGPALKSPRMRPPPTDAENVAALRATSLELSRYAPQGGVGGKAAHRLSGLLEKLANADPSARQRASEAVVVPLEISLDDFRQSLRPQPVTVADIPPDLKREWMTPDGQARVQILPSGDPDDTDAMRGFVRAVLAIEPAATGPAVMLYEAGNTIIHSFVVAGAFAIGAIALLLWAALRRVTDVLLTLIPLLLAALLTLEFCVILNIPLNFTNIIAFPLLLGVGVAFKIYYIMAWRRGRTALVQSTLTRAVVFSALTTATAFGTLWLSHHPGTSSMGRLMALELVCTMMAAVLFQPVLMGPPRQVVTDKPASKAAAARKPPILVTHAMERVDERS
ncbi:MAG TPA: MMPL family transporter [Rhizomicrobium sp.]|jgi:hypothetical protein